VAALVESVSKRCQVLLSTQSPALLDEFSPGEVVVTERRGGETGFRRLSAEALAGWLEDYSLSELYEKNVLGGQP
jgi:predicted ATPase